MYEKAGAGEITHNSVVKEFSLQYPDEDLDMVFESEDYDDARKAGIDFIQRSGLTGFPQVLINGAPLDAKYLQPDSFEEGVVTEILSQVSYSVPFEDEIK